MGAGRFLYFNDSRIWGEGLVPVKCIWAPRRLGLLPFLGGGSVVVDFLFIVTSIVGVCNCSMFCCALLYVHSSIAIILMGKRELIALLDLSSWCLVVVGRLFLAVIILTIFANHECVDHQECSYQINYAETLLVPTIFFNLYTK